MLGCFCKWQPSQFDSNEKLILLDIGVLSSDESWIIYLPVALDTGATTTILPADILTDLGYDPGSPTLSRTRMITGSGIEYAPCIAVNSILVGGENLDNVDVLCHDFPAEAGIDGISMALQELNSWVRKQFQK